MTERNVLIIEDHPLFRDALVAALTRAFPAESNAHQVGSIADGQAVLKDRKIDLVLLDLNVTDASGFDGLTRIKTEAPNCPVYIVSATESGEAYSKARSLGANGYLPKSLSMDDLTAALATALDGGTWFPEGDASEVASDSAAARINSLTPAQKRVLAGLSDGLLNKQIAYDMGISEATVKAHMTAIFRKLGANNRTQALLIYKEAISLSGDDYSAA